MDRRGKSKKAKVQANRPLARKSAKGPVGKVSDLENSGSRQAAPSRRSLDLRPHAPGGCVRPRKRPLSARAHLRPLEGFLPPLARFDVALSPSPSCVLEHNPRKLACAP